ncbi:MAG: hypothetical protein O3C43_10255 [Verrucomicrobia bacterium]|nr:hypothetical protein [Verrucomicrobiota bacterium]
MIKRLLILLCPISLGLLIPLAQAQDDDEQDKEVFELNPFNVDESSDLGYTATNTLSGTRFNSSLRDTSASVSVWTKEFIEDTGLTEIDELIDYSLNTVLDTNDQDGAGGGFNVFTNATAVTQRIRTRGVESTRGIDYFKAITPDDSYKIGRYDDSRGPNGVLFGVSAAGGIINQTSRVANTYQDSGEFQYRFGSFSRDRAEFNYNKVIIEDKLAILVAGVYQDNGHWRDWVSQDKERVYGALTWRPTEKITLRANFEDGWDHRTSLQPSTVTDMVLPWYDNFLASGLSAVTFKPTLRGNKATQVTAAQRLVGVTGADGNPSGFRPQGANRFTYIENDGTFFNAVGTYTTGGYDDERVRHPDGSPGLGDRPHRINDKSFLPYHLNPGGPDFYRETDFDSYSLFADIQITDNWFFNIQYGHQFADIDVPQLQGTRPEYRADPNTTQGISGVSGKADVPNPYVGRFFFDGDYRRDKNISEYDEIRVSTSYTLDLGRMFGRHRVAIAASEVDETSHRGNTWLALGGNPAARGTFTDQFGNQYANSSYLHADNRVTVRNYFDPDDFSTWKAGTWKNLPATITTDRFTGSPTEYPVIWAEDTPGNINYKIGQKTESQMAVSQSHFWDDRFVLTLGFRKDKVLIDRAGHRRDPVIGWIPDLAIKPDTPSTADVIPGSPQTEFDADVRTTGAVFHITNNFSLVANEATNIGIPDFRRTVFPVGATSPPPDGDGKDFGISFNLFEGMINGRFVYYETNSKQEVVGGSQASGPMEAIYSAYELGFVNNPTALSSLLSRRQELRPEVNGYFRDNVSDGFELSLTANFTDNWRLTFNASKTDRTVTQSYSVAADFLGLTEGADLRFIQGATETSFPDPENEGETLVGYVVSDAGAYASGGVISKFLELGSQLPEGQTISTFPSVENSIAGEIWGLVDSLNDRRETDEKRWGLRPYRVNVFTAYDFKDGKLKGWTVGGGYRWSSANIIGEENGVEFEGEPISYGDMFLRYRTARNKGGFLGDGRWTFQMNISNLFDNRNIIPGRLAIDGNLDYEVPGGRGGPAYARFDLPEPREYRFTVSYEF